MTEEQLAIRAGQGDNTAFADLAERMRPLIVSIARGYYAPGLELDDLHQAALIGLWRGCVAYDPDRQPANRNFSAFAAMCMHRSLATAVKLALAGKHRILDDALRLDHPLGADADETLGSITAIQQLSPFDALDQRHTVRVLVAAILDDLTDLERESLLGRLNGETYLETEARIQRFDGDRPGRAAYGPVKVVDNALSRARAKLRRIVENGEAAA